MSLWLRRLFIAIPIVWVAVAHVGPLLTVGWISLVDVYPAAPGALLSYGMRSFDAFLEGPGYGQSLAMSLGLALVATMASLAIAWPLAWYVAVNVPSEQRGLRLMLLVAPFWTSEVLRMFALVLLLANRGAINTVLRAIGLSEAPIALLYGPGSVLVGIVYTVLLTMLLPLFAAMNRLPRDLLDVAVDLGASAWQRQRYVVFPLAANGIASGVALTFLMCLGVLAAPALLGGAGTPAFAAVIASFFGDASGRWPLGAAFSLILLAVGTASAGGLVLGVRAAAGVRLTQSETPI